MKCKNTPDRSYTGKENTPLGKGYSACVEPVGKKMKGRDGKMYVVKKYKNGKRWARVTSTIASTKKSPRLEFGYQSGESWDTSKKNLMRALNTGAAMNMKDSTTGVSISCGILNHLCEDGVTYNLNKRNLDTENFKWIRDMERDPGFDNEKFGEEVGQMLIDMMADMNIDINEIQYWQELSILNMAVKKVIKEIYGYDFPSVYPDE